jgi:hypothetical protein
MSANFIERLIVVTNENHMPAIFSSGRFFPGL